MADTKDGVVINIAPDESPCDDEEQFVRYAHVLQGIIWECDHGRYRYGRRNEVAVDLAVSATMLGLDPLDVLGKLMDAGSIDATRDDEDPVRRVETVMVYAYDYKGKLRFYWEYMIDPEWYETIGAEHWGSTSSSIVLNKD